MRGNRLTATVTLVVALAGAAGARQAPPAQPRFTTGTELVTIDVVATRADGTPATGLTAADFELLEDGVPQPIAAFQFVDLTALPPPVRRPTGVTSNENEPGALFAIVIDELGVEVTDVRDVRRVVGRFLEDSLQPQDHVAVVRSSTNTGFFLTADRRLAVQAAAESIGRRDRGLRLEAAGPEVEEPDASGLDAATPENSAKQSFEVLLDAIERLRPITARRKAILWFSRGGNVEYRNMDALIANRPSGRDDATFVRVLDVARAANVAVYTIDPRGLVAPDTAGRTGPTPPGLDELGTLRDLATATGGRALVNGNDLNGRLDRVAAENRAYYLLGYQPGRPERLNGRKLDVRTRASGVSLLHRTVYMPTRKGEKAAALPLLASPLPVRDLSIALAPGEAVGARGRRGLVVPFEIGGKLPDGAEVSYTLAAFDDAGRRAGVSNGRLKAVNGFATGRAQMPIDPNTYQLRLAATMADGTTSGLAVTTVHVAPGKAERPTCGGFVLQQDGQSKGLRVFRRDAPLMMSTVVSARSLQGLQLAFGLGTEGRAPERTWPAVAGQPVADGLWQLSFTLQPPLPRGNADVTLMNGSSPLGPGCVAGFVLE